MCIILHMWQWIIYVTNSNVHCTTRERLDKYRSNYHCMHINFVTISQCFILKYLSSVLYFNIGDYIQNIQYIASCHYITYFYLYSIYSCNYFYISLYFDIIHRHWLKRCICILFSCNKSSIWTISWTFMVIFTLHMHITYVRADNLWFGI